MKIYRTDILREDLVFDKNPDVAFCGLHDRSYDDDVLQYLNPIRIKYGWAKTKQKAYDLFHKALDEKPYCGIRQQYRDCKFEVKEASFFEWLFV